MESDRSPLTEKNFSRENPEPPNIILENIPEENPEQLRNLVHSINMLPPIILADPRYVFPDTLPIFTPTQRIRLELALSKSRKISWLTIIDCVLVSFILYFGIFYLILFFIILPVIGFFASRRFHKGFSICYLIYFTLILGTRIFLTVTNGQIPAYVIQGIIILLEVCTSYNFAWFIRILKTLSLDERNFLLGRPMNGLRRDQNPEDAAVKIISDPPLVYHEEGF